MPIPPKYRLSKKIVVLLGQIEANKEAINRIKIPLVLENNIRQHSILGSALFSARIEGNTLSKEDAYNLPLNIRRDKNRVEVANLRRAYNYILQSFKNSRRISQKDILRFHKLAMNNVIRGEYPGHFRTSHEGIFDQAGNIVYHAPSPAEIRSLISQIIGYINSKKEKLAIIKAILAHLTFEKIHPFADGSGRIGRLLQFAILANSGYEMRGFANVEEVVDKNKGLYYMAIEEAVSDATNFVELILGFLVEATEAAKEKLEDKANGFNVLDLLPPRRREILETVRDHKTVSLDFLHRRFLQIDPRMLRYDLKALTDEGFIIKIGKTRGALYAMKK